MFWCKTISGNDFTTHCVFGCAWKIKFSGKAFQLIVCFMALTQKLVYIFIFTSNHFRVSDVHREREREREERVTDRTPAPRRHISRTTTEITSPPKTDPPKITSPQTDRTPPKTDPPRLITPRLIHRRLHHPRPIAPHLDCITTKDRSTQNRSHQRHRYP